MVASRRPRYQFIRVATPSGAACGALRILLIEDVDADAALMLHELQRAGLAFTSRRVSDEPSLREALGSFDPDLVLSDHALPSFSGEAALRIVHAERPNTPVIIVTGSLDEETAAEYIKSGAAEYVVKHRLFRLPTAVQRALALRQALQNAANAEAALLRSERRFRRLVEYSSDVVTLLDAAGHIVYSSQSLKPTLGYAAGELQGQNVFTLLHADDRPAAEGLFHDVREHAAVARASFRVRHQDGSWRDLEVVAANHLDDPVVEAIVVNYHDVTDRKRAEATLRKVTEQRRQAQKMEAIGRLASGVAHDFNNILTVITCCSEFLLETLDPAAPGHGDVAEIREAARRGAALTRQLLAFGREQVVAPQHANLNELVANMSGMLERLLNRGVTLRFTAAAGLNAIWADPGQVEQVVMNLAVNAGDAMPQGGQLTITTRPTLIDVESAGRLGIRPGSYAILQVRDTGSGMDAETRAHLFEPFFTTKPKGKGTGLGLATVYGIVKHAGGYIGVESEVGKGSTVEVYFPHERRGSGT